MRLRRRVLSRSSSPRSGVRGAAFSPSGSWPPPSTRASPRRPPRSPGWPSARARPPTTSRSIRCHCRRARPGRCSRSIPRPVTWTSSSPRSISRPAAPWSWTTPRPRRTTLVASTHRLFAIGERTVAGDGIFPAERLGDAVRALTRRAIAFDALAAARPAGVRGQRGAAGRARRRRRAAASRRRLRGGAFARAAWRWSATRRLHGGTRARRPAPRSRRAPARARGGAARRARGRAGPARRRLPRPAARGGGRVPPALHATVGEGLARLMDYQDAR